MKGGAFEREMAKFLTVWLTGKEKPYVYWRTPSSGGMATISEQNKEISGDIIALRPEGAFFTDRFSVELKTGYPKATFHQHLKENKNFEIENFWKQCIRDAQKADKRGMLIYRKLGFPIIVGIGCQEKFLLKDYLKDMKSVQLIFDNGTPSIAFFDMKDFFELVTPEVIKKL
jgi:hypothetical protein